MTATGFPGGLIILQHEIAVANEQQTVVLDLLVLHGLKQIDENLRINALFFGGGAAPCGGGPGCLRLGGPRIDGFGGPGRRRFGGCGRTLQRLRGTQGFGGYRFYVCNQ